MSRPPRVTVVLAAYRHAAFVTEAVRSVLDQDFADLELIAVDDASPDGTAERIAAIDDPRLHLTRLERNRAEHPRVRALAAARGEYVALQNSDDVWRPGKLRRQVERLDARPDVAAVFTSAELIDEEGRPLDLPSPFGAEEHDRHGWLRRFFTRGNCLCLPSALVRRRRLEDVGGFDPTLLLTGDLDLWVRLAAGGELEVLPEVLTANRILRRRGNLSAPSPENRSRTVFERQTTLDRYAEAPLLAELPRIFPDGGFDGAAGDETALRWALARLALEVGEPAHRLFAVRLMQSVLRAPEAVTTLPPLGAESPLAFYSRTLAETRLTAGAGRDVPGKEARSILGALRRRLFPR